MRSFTSREAGVVLARPHQHNLGAASVALPRELNNFLVAAGYQPPTAPPNAGGWNGVPDANGQCPACPPGVNPEFWVALFRRFGRSGCAQFCNLTGGTPGLGYGGMCPAPKPPSGVETYVDENGCVQTKGWLQCKQPLGVQQLAVAAGASATITVTPRKTYKAYQFHYTGAAASFVITSLNVDGVEYLGSSVPVPADKWAGVVTDHSIDIGEFSSTTPLFMGITSIAAGAADFRGALDGGAART